jgi:DUF4097 and DUF4098 domain-containing protein YvlB
MKRKYGFNEGNLSKHGALGMRCSMRFVFKLGLIALVVLMLSTTISSCSRTPSTVAVGAYADVVEETFEYSGVDKLQVEGIFFAVEVSGYTGDAVEGRIAIPQTLYDGDYIEVVHSQSGGVLKVEVKKKRATIPSFPGAAVINIRAPRDITINLTTSSGKITAGQFETDTVRLKSSSGKIKAKDLSARIEISSSSGSQDIQQCEGTLNIESSSGRISVRDVAGNVSVESSSGSQTFAEIDGNIKAKSSSGRQSYETIVGDIKAETSSGSITINEQTGELDLSATSGKLNGHSVKLTGNSSFQTSSGRISFEFENDFEDFSFDLQSSSGMLRVGESRVKGTLKMGSGPIKITGKSSSGSQEYR